MRTDDLILNYIAKSREDNTGEPDDLMKSMNKSGLVQKDVQVSRNGQTYTRKQWVKASDVKSTEKSAKKVSQATATKELKSMNGYSEGDGVRGKDGVFYAINHEKANSWFKTTEEAYENGDIEEDEVEMSSAEVLNEIKGESSKSTEKSAKKNSIVPGSKEHLAQLLQAGLSKDDIMAQAEKDGITWKHSDHAGINWMRASMAITGINTRGKQGEQKTAKSIAEEQAKSSESVIDSDYSKLTTDDEAETISGEVHNMMVGAIKSRGLLKKDKTIDSNSPAIKTLARDLKNRYLSIAKDSNIKSERNHALEIVDELDKLIARRENND